MIRTMPCLAEPGKIIVVGKPSHELTDVLPYLATLPNAIAYNPTENTLTLRRQLGFITFYIDRVYITQVKTTEEGLELLSILVDAINATWAHRHELVAVTEQYHAPKLLDIWKLLPQTNCQRCGEATCMSFAVALLQSRRQLVECLPLMEDAVYASHRAALEAML